MATYQIDLEKQHFDYYTGGHNYAWTNVYLIDCPADADAQLWMERIIEIERAVLPIDTSIRFACWRQGIGGPVPAGVQVIGAHGLLPGTGAYMPFTGTARITGWGRKGLLWFKRWRGPLRSVDQAGELLAGAYRSLLLSAYVDALRMGVPLVTRSGDLITRWEVDPRVAMWQMRHGTTRDLRSVLAG